MEILFDISSKVICNSDGLIYLNTVAPVTTTTTTSVPVSVDIYYGVSSNSTVTESEILSNFSTASGYVGSSDGRLYTFDSGYYYKYWAIQDLPNEGYRVINKLENNNIKVILVYDSYYKYYQINPTPIQSITYGKINIKGVFYRIYRTLIKTSLTNYYVYSF